MKSPEEELFYSIAKDIFYIEYAFHLIIVIKSF